MVNRKRGRVVISDDEYEDIDYDDDDEEDDDDDDDDDDDEEDEDDEDDDEEEDDEEEKDDDEEEEEDKCDICGSNEGCDCLIKELLKIYVLKNMNNPDLTGATGANTGPQKHYNKFVYNNSKKIVNIETLNDLITLLDHKKATKEQLELKDALIELDALIGMSYLKQQIINQLLYFLLDLHSTNTFLNIVITGSPGTGKTTVINTLAKIYKSIGILSKGHVKKIDRSSIVGKYLGHTAPMTKDALTEGLGGIVLFDEVYAMGSPRNEDSFAKEAIDVINQFLSEHVDDFIFIVCGYENDVEQCFFNQNQGLKRRFPWRFNVEDYNPKELAAITKLQNNNSLFKFDDDVDDEFLESLIVKNKDYFTGNGGSTKILLDKTYIISTRRNFCTIGINGRNKRQKMYPIITKEDLTNGIENMIKMEPKKLCNFCMDVTKRNNECKNCINCRGKCDECREANMKNDNIKSCNTCTGLCKNCRNLNYYKNENETCRDCTDKCDKCKPIEKYKTKTTKSCKDCKNNCVRCKHKDEVKEEKETMCDKCKVSEKQVHDSMYA